MHWARSAALGLATLALPPLRSFQLRSRQPHPYSLALAHEGENSFSAPTVIVDGVDVSLLLTQRALLPVGWPNSVHSLKVLSEWPVYNS
jgi:hypothetical protein